MKEKNVEMEDENLEVNAENESSENSEYENSESYETEVPVTEETEAPEETESSEEENYEGFENLEATEEGENSEVTEEEGDVSEVKVEEDKLPPIKIQRFGEYRKAPYIDPENPSVLVCGGRVIGELREYAVNFLKSGDMEKIPLGFKMDIPEGWRACLRATKKTLEKIVIPFQYFTSEYKKELFVIASCANWDDFPYQDGDPICEIYFEKIPELPRIDLVVDEFYEDIGNQASASMDGWFIQNRNLI